MRVLQGWDGEGGPAWKVEFKDLDEELRFLRRSITEERQTPFVRNLALRIIKDAGAPARDKKAQALAIGQWVQDNVYYVHELPERFQTPQETVRLGAGDCDDHARLIGGLLESIGIPAVLVAMYLDDGWKHIFTAASLQDRGRLLPLDSTMRFPIHGVVNPISHAQSNKKFVRLKLA